MMTQLQQELVEMKKFPKLESVVQEHREEKITSIYTFEASIVTEKTLVSSPSLYFSEEHFGEFEKNNRGIGMEIVNEDGLQWTRAR